MACRVAELDCNLARSRLAEGTLQEIRQGRGPLREKPVVPTPDVVQLPPCVYHVWVMATTDTDETVPR